MCFDLKAGQTRQRQTLFETCYVPTRYVPNQFPSKDVRKPVTSSILMQLCAWGFICLGRHVQNPQAKKSCIKTKHILAQAPIFIQAPSVLHHPDI